MMWWQLTADPTPLPQGEGRRCGSVFMRELETGSRFARHPSQLDGSVREFVRVRCAGCERKMLLEFCADGLNARDGTGLISATTEVLAHYLADLLPFLNANVVRDAAVGNDFHASIGQLDVQQHAVVLLGIPDAQLGEHHQCALARRRIAAQIRPGQRGFHRKTYLARMTALGL